MLCLMEQKMQAMEQKYESALRNMKTEMKCQKLEMQRMARSYHESKLEVENRALKQQLKRLAVKGLVDKAQNVLKQNAGVQEAGDVAK